MDKTAIKNFSIWARNKLIADITYKAGLLGVTEEGIKDALPQSTQDAEFYDIGTKEPYAIHGGEIKQRKDLLAAIKRKASQLDYKDAYRNVVEEVAYTWFNRLIAIRFMEVNDYMPAHIRVLSSDSKNKLEPDLVTTPFDAELDFTQAETEKIVQMKNDNQIDALFRFLFIKQCNALNACLPKLFEKTSDYTELLLNVSVTDQDGIVYHLTHDINEDDFNISNIGEDGKPTGQVEIIGWMYQYYNAQRKNEVITLNKETVKKEDIPAATQLFTTDWVVRYVLDNSLGKYWIERNPSSKLAEHLKFFIEQKREEIINERITPENLRVFDPCMGSGHFLIYAFEILMSIYEECGYSQRDAAKSIVENNLYGLDIDNRAFQMAYFVIMMKARQYNRRILSMQLKTNLYAIEESNNINREHLKYLGMSLEEDKRKEVLESLNTLLRDFVDAKKYGSIKSVSKHNWGLICDFLDVEVNEGQISFDTYGIEETKNKIKQIIDVARVLERKYEIVVTNPPYLNKMDDEYKEYLNNYYKDYSGDLFSVFIYRNFGFCTPKGYSGFMTPFVWMFIKSYEKLREYIIENKSIATLVQMEYSAFEEATVPICCFVLQNCKNSNNGKYFKLSEFKGGMEIQRVKVLEGLNNRSCGYYYETPLSNYYRIDGMPIAFWASEKMLEAFEKFPTISELAPPKQGLATADNNRFLRLWFEPKLSNIGFGFGNCEEALRSGLKWFPYNKGGSFRRWYGNRDYVVNWENDGEEIKNFRDENGKVRSRPQNLAYYFKPAITWSDITSATFSGRYSEQGFIFDIKGSSGFPSEENIFYILGFLNSSVSQKCIKILNPTITTQVGDMARIPVMFSQDVKSKIEELVKENISISKQDWDSVETSWDFEKHPLVDGSTLISQAFENWRRKTEDNYSRMKANEEAINSCFIKLYGLEGELEPEVKDADVTVCVAEEKDCVKSLLSYVIGCVFGRYSIDKSGVVFAGEEWNEQCYKNFIPISDNIIPLTDEEYLDEDVISRLCTWLKVAYGTDTLEENLDYIAKIIGKKNYSSREAIRNYFVNEFFKDHCNSYSITGSGKRPIYWLFDSGKQNGFKALIYMHRYNADTIGNMRVDYLHRMERIYESEINRMQDTIDNSSNAREVTAATKRKEKLQKQLKECQVYDEKIGHLALSRIDIDLDDGVKVNYEKVQTANDGKKYQVLAKI